ncbi:NAD(P)/FAD-dependent oxidoreductase [Nocardioides sp. CFH 31398]|uniref:flavin-containing monooxygenase n=1 Tax=Nocardioides sp. CFH 31398 TaxID=2919579 RepID=UPI001F0571D8|nr:NAD(P)/FAD-dependent oxidoreductase [Nocardioides sp. CFH 31398]MCH1868522.1 NAD(P)/FAD-dependent oxidoreductase [Nocardioides sp. CFH 31398]
MSGTAATRRPDVVVVGAGMAGLAATRWLRSEGFVVLTLEAYDDLGGQWHRDNPSSGVWPQMRTNTASFLTRFSDVDHPDGTAVFPRNGEVLDLLRTYAAQHDLHESLTFGARVDEVALLERGGYRVTWTRAGTTASVETPRVVVATGRYTTPEPPPVPGWDTFGGRTEHAFDYPGPEAFRDQRVVVCGGAISALEVLTDLATGGAAEVHLAQRRQRYVMPKMYVGTPVESYVFTRALAEGVTSTPLPQQVAAAEARVLRLAGNPADYGAPAPHPDFALAGVTGSQSYLNLVAEDRVVLHGWPTGTAGRTVRFADGDVEDVDVLLAATGFVLDLPFLDARISTTLGLGPHGCTAADFTFHPDLPGLALAGLWAQLGPYAVPLEQQARFIAYTFSGRAPAYGEAAMRAGLEACVREGHHVGYREQHEMALRFGRLAGVDPTPDRLGDDALLRALLPRVAQSADVFRLVGPDPDPGARERILRDARRFAAPEVRQWLAHDEHPQEVPWPA